MISRRLAATGVVVTALVGEWLGHSLAYYRVAGAAGLAAGLGGGLHAYMLPVGAVLLVVAVLGAGAWVNAWRGLGRRLDQAAAAVAALRGGGRPPVGAARRLRTAPASGTAFGSASLGARAGALAIPLALIQAGLYLVQENLERVGQGLPAPGAAPLTDGFGAAAWIQAAVALALAMVLLAAAALWRRRQNRVAAWERRVRALIRRLRRAPVPANPVQRFLPCALLELGSALWRRPPPATTAA